MLKHKRILLTLMLKKTPNLQSNTHNHSIRKIMGLELDNN